MIALLSNMYGAMHIIYDQKKKIKNVHIYKNVKQRERRDMFRKIYSGYKKYEPSMPVCVLINTLAHKICDNL